MQKIGKADLVWREKYNPNPVSITIVDYIDIKDEQLFSLSVSVVSCPGQALVALGDDPED